MSAQIKAIFILFALLTLSISLNLIQKKNYDRLADVKQEEISGKNSEIISMTDSLSEMTVLVKFWQTKFDSLESNPNIIWKTIYIPADPDTSKITEPGGSTEPELAKVIKVLTDSLGTNGVFDMEWTLPLGDNDSISFTVKQSANVDIWVSKEMRFFMDGTLHQQITDIQLYKTPKIKEYKDKTQIWLNVGGSGGSEEFDPILGPDMKFDEKWGVFMGWNMRKGVDAMYEILFSYKIVGW